MHADNKHNAQNDRDAYMKTILFILLLSPLFICCACAEEYISYAAQEFGANKLEEILTQ